MLQNSTSCQNTRVCGGGKQLYPPCSPLTLPAPLSPNHLPLTLLSFVSLPPLPFSSSSLPSYPLSLPLPLPSLPHSLLSLSLSPPLPLSPFPSLPPSPSPPLFPPSGSLSLFRWYHIICERQRASLGTRTERETEIGCGTNTAACPQICH